MAKTEPFDKYSARYDEWFEKNYNTYQTEIHTIRQFIPPGNLKSLEIGIGSGKFAKPLNIKLGIEPSNAMGRKSNALGIQVIPGTAENLPFSDSVFDFALMVTVICFVDDILLSFQESYRILKPGGFLIVGFVDKESALGRQYQKMKNSNVFYQKAVFYSAEETIHYLKQAGFKDIQTKQSLIPGGPENSILDGYGKGAFVAIKCCK